jgi:alkyl hydroperoxide reductase subunit AhpC
MADEEEDMYTGAPLQVGDEVPNFTCDSQLGLSTFHEVLDGQFSMLVTFPHDFEAVATTELGMIAKLQEEFEARNVKLFALGVDTKMNHRRWITDVEELQDCKITFPVFADTDGAVSKVFGLVRPGTVGNASKSIIAAGLTVIIDMDKRIRFISQYPSSTGRNFYELLRVIDTLQLTLFHAVATPANWMQGEDVFVRNDISNNAAQTMFPKGYVPIKEWFRITPQPDVKN